MSFRHGLRTQRAVDGKTVVWCSCGETFAHASKAIALAAQVEHSVSEHTRGVKQFPESARA